MASAAAAPWPNLPARLLLLLLLTAASAVSVSAAFAAAAPAGGGSAVVSELLGRADTRRRPPSVAGGAAEPPPSRPLRDADPYDEFAEPRSLDWPRRRPAAAASAAERLRRRVLWRIARHPDLARRQRAMERLGPLRPHARDARLDRPDPYSEFATAAYYRFVRAILDMRNRMAASRKLADFDESSGIREFFEETPPGGGGGGGGDNSTTLAPPGPTVTPSPPVKVCPPQWRLGDQRCDKNSTAGSCFKDVDCPDSRCCFDGCRLRCLEPELLVKHVCKDYMNSTVFPGDLYMPKREQVCACDELGRPINCKDKKPCIDVISSSLFKLPFLSDKTVRLKRPERTTRRKIYDALQAAFKHVKKVY